MNTNKKYNNKELTLSIEGRIDTLTSEILKKEIEEENGKFDSLILDFTNVEYISSAGLRVLIFEQKKLKSDNIPMKIIHVNDVINVIFRMSGFNKILEIE